MHSFICKSPIFIFHKLPPRSWKILIKPPKNRPTNLSHCISIHPCKTKILHHSSPTLYTQRSNAQSLNKTLISPHDHFRFSDGTRREHRNQLHDPNRGPSDRPNPPISLPRLRLNARSSPEDRTLHHQFFLHRAPKKSVFESTLGFR